MNPGDILNDTYRILSPLNKGGIGTVYLAYHENLQKHVVVKKIHDFSADLINSRIEADILKSLHHPYLPQVYDFIQINEGIFTVIDYISGKDMQYYMDMGYPFDESQLCRWLHQLCEVLNYLHTHEPKIIHCDIKPANIMITKSGDICLIDFNISVDGENNKDLVGVSSQFASPEQIKMAAALIEKNKINVRLDERSDLYSLGAVFFCLMSGVMPEARRNQQTMLKHLGLSSYSDALINIIDKLMMPVPGHRFKSAEAVLLALTHMHEWGKSYRRLTLLGRISDAGIILISLICLCAIIAGYKTMQEDKFFSRYEAYVALADTMYFVDTDSDEIERICDEGIAFINDSSNLKQLNTYTFEKANILYLIGQANMQQENYVSAVSYFEKAILYSNNDPNIYRALAIALAACSFVDEAEDYLNRAIACGLETEAADLIKAQIAFSEGNMQSAYELADAALKSNDYEIISRAAVIALRAAQNLKNYEECLLLAKRMYLNARGAEADLWLQKTGELCTLAVQSGLIQLSDGSQWMDEGIENYEILISEGNFRSTDMFNLAFLYEKNNQLNECKELLLSMERLYPKDYSIAAQLAYIFYRMENSKTSSIRNYSNVKRYYNIAVELCQADGLNPKAEADLVQLENIILQLQSNGWL